MIYETLLDGLRKHFHKKSFRTFTLLLMLTAAISFAGRQGTFCRTVKASSQAKESFSDGESTENFSKDEDSEKPEKSAEKVEKKDADQTEDAGENNTVDKEKDEEKSLKTNEDGEEKIIENNEKTDDDASDAPEKFSKESEGSEEEIEEDEDGDGSDDNDDSGEDETDEQSESTAQESASQAGVPVRIVLSGQKRFKAGDYYFYANKDFDTLLYARSDKEEGSELLSQEDFVSIFVSDGSSLYYFTSRGLERYSIDSRTAELVMPLEAGELVTPYILQVYEGKYYYTLYESDTNSVFYCYNSSDGKVSTVAEDRLAPNLYSGAEGRYMLLMSTDFSRTYLYDCSSGQTHEVGQGTVNASFWKDKLYVSQIDNYEGGSVHLSAYTLPDLKVVKAITIGENILTNSFADGYFYYSYGKQDKQGSLKEEHFVRIDPLTGDQKAISKKECNLALYNQEEPGNN